MAIDQFHGIYELVSFGFSLLLQPQNMCSQHIKSLFGDIAKQRIPMTGQGCSDLRPILRLQSLEGGRKEITIFHHDVMPLVLYEVANDSIHMLPKDLMIRQRTVDRLSDAVQTFGPYLVLASEITNLRSRSGIANS